MTLPQDSGFKWTVASTLVLAIIFAMTTFGANAGNNPPLANPPGGTISPAFSNLEASTDIIAGQNVRVGNAIKPKTGTSLALDAEKVNFTKDIEIKGKGTIDKDLTVSGFTATQAILSLLPTFLVTADKVEVSKDFEAKGKGLFGDNVQVAKDLVLGGSIVANSPAIVFKGTKLSAQNDFSVGGNFDVGFTSSLGGSLNVAKNTTLKGVLFAQKDIVASADIQATAGTVFANSINATGNISTSGNLTSSKHLSAASIGSFYFSSDKPKSVSKNGGTATFDSYCPDAKYQMISCSLQYFGPGGAPMPTPDIYNGKAHIGNSYIDRTSDPKGIHFCRGEVWNQYDVTFSFRPQVTCFDSSK